MGGPQIEWEVFRDDTVIRCKSDAQYDKIHILTSRMMSCAHHQANRINVGLRYK